jgi:hypothetical protein
LRHNYASLFAAVQNLAKLWTQKLNFDVHAHPILHINVIHVLRQRMLVKSPIYFRNAVCEYVVLA